MKIKNWIQGFKQDNFSYASGRLILANMVKVGGNEIRSSSVVEVNKSKWKTKQKKRMERRNQKKVLQHEW